MSTERHEAFVERAVAEDRATLRLKQELTRLEAERVLMIAVNEALARGDKAAVKALGVSDHTLVLLTQSGERPGYPDFALKMNAARIAAVRKRLKGV